MAKVVLGKTPEQLEAEEAERIREQEAEIQQRQMERQAKLEALHKKQKTTKIIIISVVSAVAAILLVFGTYNTFIKHDLTIEDVKPEIEAATSTMSFPSDSIGNYLHDNCEALIHRYMSVDTKNKTIKSVTVNKDSCYISKVSKLSSTLAKVYFSVDITVTENDTEVTDPNIIKKLKQAGFNTNTEISQPTINNESSVVNSENSEPIESSSNEPSSDETNPNDSNFTEPSSTEPSSTPIATNTDETSSVADKDSHTAEPTAKPAESTANAEGEYSSEDSSDTSSSGLNYDLGDNEEVHYYINRDGKIMQSGKVTTKRYSFYLPIELYVNRDESGNAINAGFRPAGEMTLNSLETVDQTTFDEITVYSALDCDEATLKDKETIDKVSVKVDKTLQDLYEGRDTSQDFHNKYKFNTYDARYEGINEIKVYNQSNALGFNTHVKYTITTSQGFQYMLDTWMLVEPNGNSYIIKDFL